LDALFAIKDEKQLIEVFGHNNVTQHTLQEVDCGPYGTKLFDGSEDEVFISWRDTVLRAGISFIRLACRYDESNESYDCRSRWTTTSGVQLGISLTNLVDLNGRDFYFYGLGWDNGWTIDSWNGGRLNHSNIDVFLGVDNMNDEQRKQYRRFSGDQKFSTANPAARSLDPIVLKLILSQH
jgi:hypothetical protein